MKLSCIVFIIPFLTFELSYAIDEPCNTTETCTDSEKSECINGVCQCGNLSQFNEELQKCLSYATEYGDVCYENSQCGDFLGENSECVNNVCLCTTGYRWYQGQCQAYAGKGDPCTGDVVCLDGSNPLSLSCIDNTCQCSSGYYDRGEDCRFESEQDLPCAISNDCQPMENKFGILTYSHCELGICIANPILSDKTKNSHCELGKCIANSIISNKTKTKEFNNTFSYFKPLSYLKQLLDGNLQNGTTEKPDTDCPNGVSSDLPEQDCLECHNTLFFKNATCICDTGFFLQDGKCMAELGMNDTSVQYKADKDCPIKPGKFVDGMCYCRDFWFQSSTNRECKKTTLEYTKSCLDNDWCKAMGPYAYCDTATEKCNCSSLAVLNETSFYCELLPDANVTNICLDNSACPLYETCADEQCQCDDGFFRVNDTGLCLPTIGYSCEVRTCNHIDNSLCDINETCQCMSEDFVSNGYVCLETVNQLNDECEIDQQCKKISHANCRNVSTSSNITSQCLCSDEYSDIGGICYAIKTPGSQCSTQFNCTVILGDTFECRNNLCQCPIGTALNKDITCVPSSASRSVAFSVLSLILTVLFTV